MIFRELFESALRLVCEAPTLNSDTADYEERASYILATFCIQCAGADQSYRQAHQMQPGSWSATTYVELTDDLPLCDIFAPAATYYLAAMLTLDENEDMSEKFFALYSDALSAIQSELPVLCESVKDCYDLI